MTVDFSAHTPSTSSGDGKISPLHSSKKSSGSGCFRVVCSYLTVMGLLMTGLGGSFIPWVWREVVALQLTAPGLAEFVKFFAEIRTAQLTVERLYFLGPLFVAMLMLPVVAENQSLRLSWWLRWPLRLSVIPLALAALSPVWTPGILINAEFRLQTMLAGLAIGLSLVAPLGKRLPLKFLLGILAVIGSAAVGLAGWQFSQIQPALEAVYRGPVSLGIGWWLSLVGLIISLAGGLGVVSAERNGSDGLSNHQNLEAGTRGASAMQ